MRLSDFQYELPSELIAQSPAAIRTGSRLMVVKRGSGEIIHDRFENVRDYLAAGDCLVLNDSRVIPARLFGKKVIGVNNLCTSALINGEGQEGSPVAAGAKIEALLVREADRGTGVWEAIVKPGKRLKKGSRIIFSDGFLTVGTVKNGAKAIGAVGGSMKAVEMAGDGSLPVNVSGNGKLSAEVVGDLPSGHKLLCFDRSGDELDAAIQRIGHIPLPPYIKNYSADMERYQTVYSRAPGSVAAPTAGLHFTDQYIDALKENGVDIAYLTLHIGPGTFAPVKAEDISEHIMHPEYYIVNEQMAALVNKIKNKQSAGLCETSQSAVINVTEQSMDINIIRQITDLCATDRSEDLCNSRRPTDYHNTAQFTNKNITSQSKVVCVGTTSMRTLESAASEYGMISQCEGWTDIFISPGYKFKCADALLTNFHLPGSTLIMLVCAFAGYDLAMEAYKKAVENRYRFYSFGDAMLIL